MKRSYTSAWLLLAALFFSVPSFAQLATFSGTVENSRIVGERLANVEVRIGLASTVTDAGGNFSLQTAAVAGTVAVVFTREGFTPVTIEVVTNGGDEDLGVIVIAPTGDDVNAEDIIPTVTLSNDGAEDSYAQNISGILTASRDPFINTAAFTFGQARFRIRGYNARYSTLFLNGTPGNDLESGGIFWSQWGGLNDVTRNRTNTVGLATADFSFGGVGGASQIDTRAATQRKQLRVSYASSNRTFNNRVMLTWTTGLLKSGWAFAASASRRWAQEGYVQGTPQDSYSYFFSADKRLGDAHQLNFTLIGAPSQRGLSGPVVQEMYDLAGTNFYNPHWGFQNGEKRNARIARNHQPMGILRHDWQLSERTALTSAVTYQAGRNSVTALDWYNARDPRPDYYRRLPSFIEGTQRPLAEEALRNDQSLRQLDWAYFYNTNRNSFATIENANGVAGNTVTGKRSQYIIEDRRSDSRQVNFAANIESVLTDHIRLQGGVLYQSMVSENYRQVEDLLGGDFYLDIDKFAEFDSTANLAFIQNDLEIPNRTAKEGDIFGHRFENHTRKAGGWAQAMFNFRRVDFFVSGQLEHVEFWRNGLIRNGKFPETSGGESARTKFVDYGGKGGVTFKIDGRNYLVANGSYQLQSPFIRNAFVSPRTRNQLIEGLKQERIESFELSYVLNSPYVRFRGTAYHTIFRDQFTNRSFYLDNAIQTASGVRGGFVNYIMTDMDTRHRGVELGAEFNFSSFIPGLRATAVAAIGEYTYHNRPEVTVYLDNVAQELSKRTVYIKNYYLGGTPQSAYSLGLSYNSPKFWFLNVNFNYYDRIFIDIYPERRTTDAVSYVSDPQFVQEIVTPESELWNKIIDQERMPAAFTVDLFGGKSWRIKRGRDKAPSFIYLNVGVSNLLDKRDFVTGGFEQSRFEFAGKDVDRFPNRYFYSFGRTYFASLAYRLW